MNFRSERLRQCIVCENEITKKNLFENTFLDDVIWNVHGFLLFG